MRGTLLLTTLGWLGAAALAEAGAAHVVQKFDNADTNITTATFTVQDKWEVLWFSPRPINITLLAADGTVVTGLRAAFKGSLYVPKGGTFYFQVNSTHPEIKEPWHLIVAEVGAGTDFDPTDVGPMFATTEDPNYAPPASVLPPVDGGPGATNTASATPPTPASQPTPAAPAPASAPTAPTPAPATAPAAPAVAAGKMSEDQARAVVLIKGDNAEGTGFLVKGPDGPAVVTNIHVIANNPNIKITTNTGALVTVVSEKGASDRDLAMLAVRDDNFNYLDLAPDISRIAQPGDDVITPGNSQGGEVMLNTTGKVLGIGPQRVEIDNPIYHGNSGGPVFHSKSGKVLGVVTEAIKVDISDDLDKTSFASRNSAISGSMRYFALRLDTVPAWIPIKPADFQVETTFLDEFQEQSRRLDAYLNSSDNSQGGNTASGNSGDDSSKIYLDDKKIMRANDSFEQQSNGADTGQRLEALRGLLSDLQSIADINLTQMQNDGNFYSFDLARVHDELDYRKALKAELNSIGGNVDRLGGLPRSN